MHFYLYKVILGLLKNIFHKDLLDWRILVFNTSNMSQRSSKIFCIITHDYTMQHEKIIKQKITSKAGLSSSVTVHFILATGETQRY